MTLKRMEIQNFKGITNLTIDFKDGQNMICGQNASGKTSIFDALTWLLFGKDSANREKFDIRPLDENGEKVHNVEIFVSATFDVMGKEITFSKKQKENWIKKRGSDAPTLQGNVNTMEINGFPKSDREFKEEVSGFVDEDIFKMLTNPLYFPSLPWKEQRNILMRFVSDVSDVDLAKELGGYDDLMSDLEFAKDTDEIQKKYARQIKELREKADEIPTRIDEAEKSRVYGDTEALENKRKGIKAQIESLDKQIRNGAVDVSELQDDLNKVNKDIAECKEIADDALRKRRGDLKDSLADIQRKLKDKQFERSQYKDRIIEEKRLIADRNARIETLRKEYKEVKEKKISPNATVCPSCGREFEADKIAEITEHFAKDRADSLTHIDFTATKINDQIKESEKNIEEWQKKVEIIEKAIEPFEPMIHDIEKEISELPDVPDYTVSDRYNELVSRKEQIESEMAEQMINSTDTSELEVQRKELDEQLKSVDGQIACLERNNQIDERVATLEQEQKEVQQKIADAERLSFLLENFVKSKMERISKAINEKFEVCDFKLFESQINSGIKECCELMVNGVPFSVLNSGHRIVAGLDIIASLEDLYDRCVPVWIDNAESVNAYNMPQIEGLQTVLLVVTDDEKLKFM